jgi:hypothetical protein
VASLQARIEALATTIGNYLRDSILPRCLPAGGAAAMVLTKTSGANYAAGWQSPANAPWAIVKKAADQQRTANAVLGADSELTVALGIGRYIVRGVAWFTTANATMDYKYDCSFTGAASYTARLHRHIAAGSAAGTDNETSTIGTGVIPSTAVAATTTGLARVEFEVIIDVTGAGTFQFRWAQNTSDAGAMTCLRGSYLEYTSV